MTIRRVYLLCAFLLLIGGVSCVSAATYIDNTKTVTVYLENAQTQSIVHDPFCESLFYEYNLKYVFNGTISGNLSTVDLLVIPGDRMTNTTASTVNTFINNGGNVWFLSDPVYNENGVYYPGRFTCLATGNTNYGFNTNTNFVVNYTDPLTSSVFSGTPAHTTETTYVDNFPLRGFAAPEYGTYNGFAYVNSCAAFKLGWGPCGKTQ